MDELAHYVLKYYPGFMTREEALAYKHLQGLAKLERTAANQVKARIREAFCTDDAAALALLADGAEVFYERVRDRILREHKKQVFLNYCPGCGSLAKTTTACQCAKCGHEWGRGSAGR